MNGDLRGRTVLGTFFDAPHVDRVDCLKDALIAVDAAGVIERIVHPGSPEYHRCLQEADVAGKLVRIPGMMLPGFVDLHVHAPQYPQLGKALDEPLEVWLQRYTFPLEAGYADLDFAAPRYTALVEDLVACGTTTALYFATVDLPATKLLADICLVKRQRGLIGKVAMDNPAECPSYYRDASAQIGISQTREFIAYARTLDPVGQSILPVVTPRFTPSCTDDMLAGLGALAHETGCHIQTHCSESDWAHGYAHARFGRSDVAALDTFGLIGRLTVLAHANFLSADDMHSVAARGASIAHCPYSNFYFANAVFPLRAALAKGLRIGLGTDISGGPSASMFDSLRMAVIAGRMLESGVDPRLGADARGRAGSGISLETAFYLATAGGGDALALPVGRFAPGYAFDALAIDPDAPSGTIRLWNEDDDRAILHTLLMTASRANIAAVWVAGISAKESVVMEEAISFGPNDAGGNDLNPR